MFTDTNQEFDKCKGCRMPLENEQDVCSCDPTLCYHCCKCGDDCVCGCKNRVKKSEMKAEF
jgi:hypothetical protein